MFQTLQHAFFLFLKKQTIPYPGRTENTLRFLLASALIIIISLTLQVPLISVSLMAVFFTIKENTTLTFVAGIVILLGLTLSCGTSILLLKYTFGYPMLRIIGATAILFFCLYFFRISPLGIIGFMMAIIVIYSQSFVDEISNPDTIVRLILWAWVAIAYAVAVSIMVNYLFAPKKPKAVFEKNIRSCFANIANDLLKIINKEYQDETRPLDGLIIQLQKELNYASIADKSYRKNTAKYMLVIHTIDRLQLAMAVLDKQVKMRDNIDDFIDQIHVVYDYCSLMSKHFGYNTADYLPTNSATTSQIKIWPSALVEMTQALHSLLSHDNQTAEYPQKEAKKLLVKDAFTNPAYMQFALRTVLITLCCYVFYTATQWSGIHTIMLTCIIVALPTVGMSKQKGWQRLLGCSIGSLAALLSIVFIIPHLDGIVGILILSLVIIALGSWIASGPEESAYVGMQIILTYALSIFATFGPVTDLTEVRDRMIGVILGIVVSFWANDYLWPEKESHVLFHKFALIFEKINALLQVSTSSKSKQYIQANKLRNECRNIINENKHSYTAALLESSWSSEHAHHQYIQTWFSQIEDILLSTHRLQMMLLNSSRRLPKEVLGLGKDLANLSSSIVEDIMGYFNHYNNQPAQFSTEKLDHAFNEFALEMAKFDRTDDYVIQYEHAAEELYLSLHSFIESIK